MTFYYRFTNQSNNRTDLTHMKKWFTHVSDKTNWRIVELPNGYYQSEYKPLTCEDGCDPCDCNWIDTTRRETLEGAERAIDSSIEHYRRKLRAFEGPRVVKTFDNEQET